MKAIIAQAVVLAAMIALCPVAQAINKCTGLDGKVAFQDAPCAAGKAEQLEVWPASGPGPRAQGAGAAQPDAAAAGGQPVSEVQRLESEIAKSQAARRKRDLEVVGIPNARRAISQNSAACHAEQESLRGKKTQVKNNLAGATWAQSISEEMTAAARVCASRAQQLRAELDALRSECSAVNCVPEGQ